MNKWAFILGATSDIATELAHLLAKSGFNLYLTGTDLNQVSKIASDIKIRHDIKTIPLEYNLLDKNDFPKIFTALKAVPELFISAAGYLGKKEQANTKDEIEKVISINFTETVKVLQFVANEYKDKDIKGTIVGIGSVAGDRGRASNYVYGSAKSGLHQFLSGLGVRYAKDNINVITIKPGFVTTKMTEGMKFPKVLASTPQIVAKDILRAIQRGTSVVYTPWFWRWISMMIVHIPYNIIKKLSF